MHRYINSTIQKKNLKIKRLPKLTYEGEEYHVINRSYITPFTNSIISDNYEKIYGFLIDIAWKILLFFVTSIMMASSFKTGNIRIYIIAN